jgi:hypothetical protein
MSSLMTHLMCGCGGGPACWEHGPHMNKMGLTETTEMFDTVTCPRCRHLISHIQGES